MTAQPAAQRGTAEKSSPKGLAVLTNNIVVRSIKRWLEPRSTNRDEAFREQTIRITISVLFVLSLLSLLVSLFVFGDLFEPVSYPAMLGSLVILTLVSGIMVSQSRLLFAGWLLVIALMLVVLNTSLIGGYWDIIIPPTIMIITLLSALILPRSAILPIGMANFVLFTTIALAQTNAGITPPEPSTREVTQHIINMIFILVTEVVFLYRLRVEFDNRLAAMRVSIREAEDARREADNANRAKSQFLANMSHELRTPLNAIIGYTEIMLGGMVGAFTEKQTELQSHVQTNARRLLGLINDVLDLAKIESGTLQVLYTVASPAKFVTETVASMKSLAEQKNIDLKTTIEPNAPANVLTDVNKVQQIVTNLVGNAIKFTQAGNVDVKVGVLDSNTWYIKVSDTGRGMPAEAVNYIFDIFRQVEESDSREQKGTGLGLAITKRLIDRMGGAISVETALGKGSTFTVKLPLQMTEKPTV